MATAITRVRYCLERIKITNNRKVNKSKSLKKAQVLGITVTDSATRKRTDEDTKGQPIETHAVNSRSHRGHPL